MSNPLATFFGFTISRASGSAYLPDIYPLPLASNIFVDTDIQTTYSKVLIDVVERTEGIPEKFLPMLWDNCVQSETSDGLISLLAKALAKKEDLCFVVKQDLGTVRKATGQEMIEIKADYAKSGKSTKGVYVSFRNNLKADMFKFYSQIEYCVIGGLYKTMNLSKAIQIKVSELRASVSLADSAKAKEQALEMAEALALGKDILLDAKDVVETGKPDITPIKEAVAFLDAKRCHYLGMPMSYVTGEAPKGLGDSGEGDAKAVERGLKSYYFSIIKPVLEAAFNIKTTFKSQDFRQLVTAMEALRTFELVDEQYISKENKLLVVNTLLGLDSPLGEEPEPEPVLIPGQTPPSNESAKSEVPPKKENE